MIRKDSDLVNILMFIMILILLLLDTFVPNTFYNNLIDNTRIFRLSAILITLSGLLGTILVKFENKRNK